MYMYINMYDVCYIRHIISIQHICIHVLTDRRFSFRHVSLNITAYSMLIFLFRLLFF